MAKVTRRLIPTIELQEMTMRLIPLLGAALLMVTAPVGAEAATTQSRFVVKGSAVESVPVAEWEAGGKAHSAIGHDQVAKAPKKASRYSLKAVSWPTGTVRVLTFKKAGGGVVHAISDETELFVLKGSVKVDVGGKSVELKENDMISLPKGVVHGAGDATLVTWTVGSLIDGPTQKVVRAAEAGTMKVPSETTPLTIHRYDFPGNSVRWAVQGKGGSTGKTSAKTDSLIYMTSGHMRLHEGAEVVDVVAGDFVWEETGQEHFWDQLEDSSFVTTSGIPKGAKVAPGEATDMPGKK